MQLIEIQSKWSFIHSARLLPVLSQNLCGVGSLRLFSVTRYFKSLCFYSICNLLEKYYKYRSKDVRNKEIRKRGKYALHTFLVFGYKHAKVFYAIIPIFLAASPITSMA